MKDQSRTKSALIQELTFLRRRVAELERWKLEFIQPGKEIEEQKIFCEEILREMVSGVWVTDKNDVIFFANRGMAVIAGIPLNRIVGVHVLTGFPGSTLRAFISLYLQAKDTLEPRYYDALPVVTPSGHETYQSGWLIPRVKEDNYDGMICTVEDVTERKQLETRLAEARRMEAIGKLASGAAHEIRNPLNIMSVKLQTLEKMEKDLNENVQTAIDISKTQIKRIIRILDGLYEFSRIPEIRKSRENLKNIIEEVLTAQAEHLRSEGVAAQAHCGEGIPLLMLDKDRIATVITRLVSNAVEAMKDRETKRLGITIQKTPAGDCVRVVVSDTGHGIEDADRSRIFDPFFTTRDPDKGKGLGLSISYGIIQDHGGTIRAESNDDGGATFIIELPA